MKFPLPLFLCGLCAASCLQAQITYVDATSTNTTGSTFVTTANVYTDNLWSLRTVGSGTSDAAGNTIFEAGPQGGSENAPVLSTRITGLTPGASYEIYAYFITYPTTDATQLWRIRAGLVADILSPFDRDSADTTVLTASSTTALVNPAGTALTVPSTRNYRQASLGIAVADSAGTISVFIDSGIGTNDANHRTWYDGVGYKSAGTATSAGSALPITVDPAGTVTASWVTEWNTDGGFEGWVTGNATATVSGGLLSATATAANPSVSVSAFSGGPDLDLGFNDFLDLRIQVPAAYTGAIQIYYGTALTTGLASTRVLTIPAAKIPKDGAFHVYRIDLGLEVFWRATLRDLRIVPVGGSESSGLAFAIDFIRIGDDPNAAIYQARVGGEAPAVGGTITIDGTSRTVIETAESKHFRFVWDSLVASNGSWTSTRAHNTLRNLEEAWQLYTRTLGYREPAWAAGTTSGTRYKVNITSWYSGYWAGMDGSYARINITPDGLRENPPSIVAPHELMHVFQFHNTSSNVPGEWWEGHANYGRERYLQLYSALFPANQRSGIDPTYLRCAHQMIGHGRDYYLSWPLFLYLDKNPDSLSDLGEGTNVKLWQQTAAGEYPLMTLERLTPSSTLKDIVGYFARRGATYNYATKADIQAALAGNAAPQDNAATLRWQFTDLVPRSDDPTWWRVPSEMAPMQGAYAIHELVSTGTGAGRIVTVKFHGLPDGARGADWRVSFIVIADDGTERYSPLWNDGTNSVTLSASENKVYLSVAGAPATFYTGGYDEPLYPYRSYPSKTRFPYEIQVTGAAPRQRDNGSSVAGLVQHANGGGYKAGTATVASTAYLGPNARVLGNAVVSGNARIEDYALVYGSAQISGNAVVSGHAWVRGGAVTGNAKVRDWALVDAGTISGSARVLEHANIKGGTVTDLATAKGTSGSLSGVLSGNAIMDGDCGDFFSGRDIANSVAFGFLPYTGVPDSYLRALPPGLYASYDFSAAHDSRIFDQYGATDGLTSGSPTWVAADAKRRGFLTFDGSTQSVLLDRSIADLRDFTFTAWVKPAGGAANQAVLWLGASSTRRLSFTPNDGTGHAKFSIVNGGAEQTLLAPAALPIGIWTHIAVTLDGATGVLFLNGSTVATGAITIRPDQLLAANTAAALQHNYLARSEGGAMPKFHGALDDVQFYASALSASDIAAWQPATVPATAGTLYVDLRASDSTAGSATWTNGGALGNFTRVGSPSKVANVLGTGVPGVLFNGTSGAYTSVSNTVADLEGSSDRSIEVWACNPALAAEETPVSWGRRSATRTNVSLNFGTNSGWGAATHLNDDLGWGTPPTSGAWHHLAYVYNGTNDVRVYLDGTLANSKTLSGVLATTAANPVNIAAQRGSGGSLSQYFSGYINSVRIHGGALTATQIAADASAGPDGAPANVAPTLAAIPEQSLNAAASSTVSVTAGDSDTPLAALTLSASSSNEAILPAAGILFSGAGAIRTAALVPAAIGTATITFTISDGASTTSRTFNVTVRTASQNWRQQYFGTTENTGDAADTADPNHDGISNLLEFFLNRNPIGANASSTQPITALDGANLTLTYSRRKAALTELSSAVQWSDTMAANSWNTAGVTETILSDDGIVQSVKASVARGAGQRFLRLKVTRP